MNERIRFIPRLKRGRIIPLILLVSLCCSAQKSAEFFTVSYSSASKSRFGDGGRAGLDVLDMNLITPTIDIGENTKLNNIFAYKLLDYELPAEAGEARNYPGKLHDIQYALLIRQKLDKQWNLMFVPQFIVRSNFKSNFGTRDLFPALAVIAMRKSRNHEGLEWGYGASYSRDFTKNTFTPLFAISYLSSRYRVDMVLPVKAQFVLTPSKTFEYGIEANLETGIYNIGTKNDFGWQYTRTMNVPVGMTAAAEIYGMLWVKAKVGMQFLREYDFLDRSYSVVKNQEGTIEASAYASLGISLRLKE